jgi:hypothetical protein
MPRVQALEAAVSTNEGNIASLTMSVTPNRRAAAPAPENYVVVPGSQGPRRDPRRDLRTSVGPREGWDAEGRVFDVSEAVQTARAWMRRRVEAGQPALSGMFTCAEVTYLAAARSGL